MKKINIKKKSAQKQKNAYVMGAGIKYKIHPISGEKNIFLKRKYIKQKNIYIAHASTSFPSLVWLGACATIEGIKYIIIILKIKIKKGKLVYAHHFFIII